MSNFRSLKILHRLGPVSKISKTVVKLLALALTNLVLDLANLVTNLAKKALANLVSNLTKPSLDLDKPWARTRH